MRTAKPIRISRRSFMKGTVGLGALATLGILDGPLTSLAEKGGPPQEDVWVPTFCSMCHSSCNTLAHRVNGVVVKIEGNPNCPHNQGRICGKAHANIMLLYDPYRVKVPLKRTNPQKGKGVDPKWVEISWDEALNIIAEKLKAVRAKDPRAFIHAVQDFNAGAFNGPWRAAFGHCNKWR